MANLLAIKKRTRSVKSTQKTTKAMKLVSLSKLLKAREKMLAFEPFFRATEKNTETYVSFAQDEDIRDRLYVIVMPDLGLCSAYIQGLAKKFLSMYNPETDAAIVIGKQQYKQLKQAGVNVANDLILSEDVDFDELMGLITPYFNTHEIVTIVPEYVQALSMDFLVYRVKTNFEYEDGLFDVIYEPDYTDVANRIILQSLQSLIMRSYYVSKVSEHTTRRIAMEKATDNAQEMIEDLDRQYNRLRQEAITQELTEILSGMEG